MKPDRVGTSDGIRSVRSVRAARPDRARARRPGRVRRGGFNLVELVLVIAMTAMISAIAIPRYASSIARYRADAAVKRVAADLALAQSHASTAGKGQSVVFVARGYQMPGVPHLDGKSYGDYTVDLGAEPYGVTRVAAEFGGDATVKFDLYGNPDTGGSVVVIVGDVRRVVTLAPESGKVAVK